jgi:hypothetical protein
MSLIAPVLDWLAMLTEPYWLTLAALGGMLRDAGAGTALVGGFLLLLSLDFLRGSKGIFVPVSRALAVGSTLFVLASFVYGDFLAAPAKAAYSAIVARSASVSPNVVVLTTLGAASASAFLLTSRRIGVPRAFVQPSAPKAFAPARREAALAALSGGLAMDAAGRLQLRQFARNPKKTVATVRSAMRAMPGPVARYGRRVAMFERV